jgi:RNA polymerase sigma-32 factor
MKNNTSLPMIALGDSNLYQYLRQINKIESLTKEEEYMLAKAYLEKQDLKAAHKLVMSHLKLVAKIALTYKNYGLPVTDLISEGNLGLMHAVKKYDPNLGHRLSTYSMWWIKAYMQEYILKSWSLVKIGTTAVQKKLFFSLNKIKKRITNLYSRPVIDSDYKKIAEEFDIKEESIREMDIRLSQSDLSLNLPKNSSEEDGESGELIDFIRSPQSSQDVVMASRQEAEIKKKLLKEALTKLNERELYILQARKLSESPQTLDDLSIKFDISKERVRQIENRAFEKIQSYMYDVSPELFSANYKNI